MHRIGGGGVGLICGIAANGPCGIHALGCSVQSDGVGRCVQRSSTMALLSRNVCFSIGMLSTRHRHVAGGLLRGKCCGFGGRCVSCATSAIHGSCLMSLALRLTPCERRGRSAPRGRQRCAVGGIDFVASCGILRTSTLGDVRIGSSLRCGKFPVCCGSGLCLHPGILAGGLHVVPKALCGRRGIRHACSGCKHLRTLGCAGVHFFRIRRDSDTGLGTCIVLAENGRRSMSFRIRNAGSTNSLKTTTSITFRRHGVFGNSRAFVFGLHKTCRTISNLRDSLGRSCVRLNTRTAVGFPQFVFPFMSDSFGQEVETAARFKLRCGCRVEPRFAHVMTSTK